MKLIFLSLLFYSLNVAGQSYAVDSAFIGRFADTMLTDTSAYSNLRYLTKHIGGRLAGSPQMKKAEDWGFQMMQQAGADNVTRQSCQVPHWIRGGKDKTTVFTNLKSAQASFEINVLAIGNSVGTGPKGLTAPLIRIRSFEELQMKKEEVKGKIVFFSVPFEETFVETFKAYGKNIKYRAFGASRAAEYGAVGVLVRSMTNSVDNEPHTGTLLYIDSFPKIPAVAVGLHDVRKLDALIDHGSNLKVKIVTGGKMLPDETANNIIGELKGSEYPQEYINVGGHLDSWDINEGATDDGAGIVQTLEILRCFKAIGYKPKHTIRFVFFANEENSGRGSKKYAATAKEKNEQHIFALESDAGGFTPRGFRITADPAGIEKIKSWKPYFEPYLGGLVTEGSFGADVEPLHDSFNIPVGELNTDSQRYFDVHHARSDVLENVNIRELKLGAINMAILLYLVDTYGLPGK